MCTLHTYKYTNPKNNKNMATEDLALYQISNQTKTVGKGMYRVWEKPRLFHSTPQAPENVPETKDLA